MLNALNLVFNLRKSIRWLFCAFLILPLPARANKDVNDIPYSAQTSLKKKADFIEVSKNSISKTSYTDRNKSQSPFKTFHFADLYNVSFSPENSGTWEETEFGKVWRLGIRSSGAFSLYLTFYSTQLASGTSLFVYSPDYKSIRHPITNSKGDQLFSIAPLSGNQVIIELDLPKGIEFYGRLNITKVYHDRLNIFGDTRNENLTSASCNEGINCDNGTFWQTEKRAVCKIVTDGALSSGTLLANTKGTNEPYLLTAYHTMFDSKHAEEAVFIFNYEFPTCTSNSLNDSQSISGSTLLVTEEGKDYALLKLNEIPPPSFNVYYAGWSFATDLSNPVACIHHPYGTPKQIAISYRNLESASYSQSYTPDSFWKVKWDVGTTAPGSSGSALFNKQHRVVGILTGGTASCGSGSDYFNKLSSSQILKTNTRSLRNLLDPNGNGTTEIDGYDPNGFDQKNCNLAWNIESWEKVSEGFEPGDFPDLGSNIRGYAENFYSPGSILIPGVYLNVAKVSYENSLSQIILKVWEGEVYPSKEIFSKAVFIKDLRQEAVNFISFDTILRLNGNFFVGYDTGYSPTDNVTLYRSQNRGRTGTSSMFVFDSSWRNINTYENGQYSSSLGIGLSECYGKVLKPIPPSLSIYPNPSTNYLNFKLPERLISKAVKCFDLTGKEMDILFYPEELKNTVYFNLPQGIYLLQVKTETQDFYSKFMVNP